MRKTIVCPMASPHDSPSGKTSTNILVVEVKSAAFNYKKKATGNIYMNLWINPKTKLKSRTVRSPKPGSRPIIWNQKFVFSLSHDFFNDKNSSFRIQIARARNYLPDSELGVAECKLGFLFSSENDDKNIEDQANYDSEYGSGSDTSLSESVTEGWNRNESESKSKSVQSFTEDQGSLCDDEVKKLVSLEILKGLVQQGVLNVEMTLKRELISYIGKAEIGNFAMEYDEFMMDVEQKGPLCMCFPYTQSNK